MENVLHDINSQKISIQVAANDVHHSMGNKSYVNSFGYRGISGTSVPQFKCVQHTLGFY